MNTGEPIRKCSRCGASLPADAPEGLCPRCLIALNLATQTDVPGEVGPHGTKVTKPPLSPADIAKYFPQLEILECLGRGGMGVVYKARQARLDRFIALKILAPEKENDAQFAERFTREARALARLNHANIVTVHDFGEVDGLYYLLMEFVDGANLRQLLQSRHMAPEEALSIVPKICEALQYAHDQGIVHRDIKPENVLVDKQGRVKIADFGIAKIVGADGKGTLTESHVVGTPHYMAPEQIEQPTKVDHRADIYSLGVVFYEMLTGELPLGKFQAPSKKVHVDVRLDEVVLHTLEKEPERRYQHASEVKTDVETIAGSAPARQATPKSGMVRLFETIAGVTVTSRAAVRTLNISALGFLGSLSALGVLPGMRWCLGFSGFFGFFGLIGVAYMIEIVARRKTRRVAGPPEVASEVNPWQPAILLLGGLGSVALLLMAAVLPRPGNWLALLFGSFGVVVATIKLAGLWPFPSGVFPRSNFTRRNLPSACTNGPRPQSHEPSAATEEVRRQVKAPAIALLVTGILNWVAIPFIVIITAAIARGKNLHGGLLIWVPLAALIFSSLMIVAGLKMKRLEAYGLAITGSILAMLISPGNLVGLPVGIWALVVLSHREVREAFARNKTHPADFPAVWLPWSAWILAGLSGVLGIAALCLFPNPPATLVWSILAAVLLGIFLGVWARGTSRGRQAMAIGAVNTVLWLIIAAAGLLTPRLIHKDKTTAARTTERSNADADSRRKFVRLVMDSDRMTFEGQQTSWDEVGALLANVSERLNTVLEFAVTSDRITVAQQNEWFQKAAALAPQHGFEYASFVGIHPLGSKGASELQTTSRAKDSTLLQMSRVPAVVISTIPESGASDVDPALNELRVTFSKPMQDGAFSWPASGEQNFPETTGQPRFLADGQTCVVPVKLKPGKVYAIWINSNQQKTFTDTERQPSVPFLLIFETHK